MSGGALDYSYHKIDSIVEEINKEISKAYEEGNTQLGLDLTHMKNHLYRVRDALKSFEYYLSHDNGEYHIAKMFVDSIK